MRAGDRRLRAVSGCVEDKRIRCKVTGRTKIGVGLSALPPA
jgi:hypothetical protein